MNSDNQVLFWVVIIGVLSYMYVDLRMARLRDEFRMNLMAIERVLQQQGRVVRENYVPTPGTVRTVNWQEDADQVREERAMRASPKAGGPGSRVYVVDDVFPTKEEMAKSIGMSPPNQGGSSFVPFGAVDRFAPVPGDLYKR